MQSAFGGGFSDGFAAGFAGSLVDSAIGPNSDSNFGEGIGMLGRTITAGIVGGTVSEFSGGEFANGAATAAFQHLLNAEMSRMRQAAPKHGGLRDPRINWKDYTKAHYEKFISVTKEIKPTMSASGGVGASIEAATQLDPETGVLTKDINIAPGGGGEAFVGVQVPLLPSHGNPSSAAFDLKSRFPIVVGVSGDLGQEPLFYVIPSIDSVDLYLGVGAAASFRLPDLGDLQYNVYQEEVPVLPPLSL